MIVILIGLALVAIYANVQKVRRDKIERVTITPVSTATPGALIDSTDCDGVTAQGWGSESCRGASVRA